jgi:hypothetical protein
MQNNPPASKKTTNWFWPPVDSLDAAKEAAKQGAIAAALVAGITAIVAILSLFGLEITSLWALVDAALFALIAFGIYKLSRVAAVLGLLLYLWEQISQILITGKTNIILVVLFTLYFIHAIRGTFAYHKLKEQQPEPAIEQV